MKLFKEKCDGCKAKLKDDDHTIVKFKVTDQENGEDYESSIKLCPNCALRIEDVLKEELESGRATEHESL